MEAAEEKAYVCKECGNTIKAVEPLGDCVPRQSNAEEYVQALAEAEVAEPVAEKKKRTKKS